MTTIYSINVGNTTYEIYQSEGSSRYNVRTLNVKSKRARFLRGFQTYEAARSFVDVKATPKDRRLV